MNDGQFMTQCKEKLHYAYHLMMKLIKLIKFRTVYWASRVARLREARIAYSILAGKDPNREAKIILIEVFREIGSRNWW